MQLQHVAMFCVAVCSGVLQSVALDFCVLQYVAVAAWCNVLCCSMFLYFAECCLRLYFRVLQDVAVAACCNVLRCSMFLCFAECCLRLYFRVLQYVAVAACCNVLCCSMSLCFAECCLRFHFVCCSMLQLQLQHVAMSCVAVCHCVLQSVALDFIFVHRFHVCTRAMLQ